ncbi:MAG TPA: hypothetical protein VLA62_03100, partial [Solirubrobacterales bacterium]|nr:hypothetical protein [Solirubrobacterales bacterium]
MPRAFALATVWLCPAVLSVLGERVLTDGTRGPWLAQALAGSAAVSVILLAGPWARFGDHGEADLVDLVRQRFTRPGAAGAVLALASVLGTWLYLWAQLRAGRELARLAGWPAAAPTVGLGLLLVLLAWAPRLARPLSGLASTVALAALLLCLGTVLARTTPVWPGVWEEVASRGPARFSDQSPWTHAGGPVRGPGAELRVTVTEEQRLSLLAATPTRVERWDGTVATSYSQRGEALLLGPQDRLLVPDGTPIRFEAGRVIPGTPPSGPEWLDPAGPRADWRAAIGLLATLVLGGLGLGPVQAALPAGGADDRAGPLAAAVVALASLGTLLWALYALWLTPELYVGGLAAFEPYLMPAGVPHLGDLGALLAPLALAAVALAGVSSGLIALGAFRVVAKLATEANLEGPGRVLKSSPWSLGGMAGRGTALLAGAAAGALAILVPLDAWTVVV